MSRSGVVTSSTSRPLALYARITSGVGSIPALTTESRVHQSTVLATWPAYRTNGTLFSTTAAAGLSVLPQSSVIRTQYWCGGYS